MTLLFPETEEEVEPEIRVNVWWETFVSGAVAGMISRTATAPFDRLKTVMQVKTFFFFNIILHIFRSKY